MPHSGGPPPASSSMRRRSFHRGSLIARNHTINILTIRRSRWLFRPLGGLLVLALGGSRPGPQTSPPATCAGFCLHDHRACLVNCSNRTNKTGSGGQWTDANSTEPTAGGVIPQGGDIPATDWARHHPSALRARPPPTHYPWGPAASPPGSLGRPAGSPPRWSSQRARTARWARPGACRRSAGT